ncbi:M56 family metallopeptidase [Mucilaginibacter sp. HD30]
MPEFFTFLIKVNIALVLFCLGYYLVLRKLTFYTLNRAYLVTAIIFASVYPFIDLSVFAQHHQEIVAPVQNVVIIWQAPAQNFVKQAAYWNWLEIAFWTGVAVFAARLLFQMVSLYKIHARSATKQINGQAIRVVNGDISPFSFWKNIYVNPDKLSSTDLKNVLAHEQVHVDEWHTLDVLLTEISVVFYWFNPGIWMMKRAVRENIEFITDRKILQKGLDSKAYQYSLLNITFNQPAPAITSNFNLSTLKKRIKMMNAKRSSKLTLTRYAFLVPVVMVCLFAFSLSKAEAVKSSPAFKAVAAAVKNINNVVLNNDTVPATTRNITGTVTVKKGINGTTKTITLKGADVDNLSFTIDSPKIERHTVTITGQRPGKKDSVITFTIEDKPMGSFRSDYHSNFNSSGLTGIQLNVDNVNINKIGQEKSVHLSVPALTIDTASHQFIYKDGDAKLAATTFSLNNNVVISAPVKTTMSVNKDNSVIISSGAHTVGTYYNNNNVVDKGKLLSVNPDKNKEVIVEGRPIPSNGLWHVITDKNGNQTSTIQPLYVVDGKLVNQKDLKSFEGKVVYLNPETAILKYGTKGENGALVITTKDAKK